MAGCEKKTGRLPFVDLPGHGIFEVGHIPSTAARARHNDRPRDRSTIRSIEDLENAAVNRPAKNDDADGKQDEIEKTGGTQAHLPFALANPMRKGSLSILSRLRLTGTR